MKWAHLNNDLISLFDPKRYILKVTTNKNLLLITFLESFYIITVDNLTYLNCSFTLNYLKHNINLNLFYKEQVDLFLSKCLSI